MKEILIVNKSNLEVSKQVQHDRYQYKKFAVGKEENSLCCVAVYEIAPHKESYPYHYHLANTEVFFVLSGEGILLTPQGERQIKTGDFIICPPNEQGCHKIVNNTDKPLTYIDFDTNNKPDIVRYPHSDKTGIMTKGKSQFFKNNSQADYYDGE